MNTVGKMGFKSKLVTWACLCFLILCSDKPSHAQDTSLNTSDPLLINLSKMEGQLLGVQDTKHSLPERVDTLCRLVFPSENLVQLTVPEKFDRLLKALGYSQSGKASSIDNVDKSRKATFVPQESEHMTSPVASRDFDERVKLGDSARKDGRFQDAISEYKAALSIVDDATVHEKLGDVYHVVSMLDLSMSEYKLSIKIRNSAQLQLKLGQVYHAKKELAKALTAYGEALRLNPNDSNITDSLTAAWNDAIKANPLAPENHLGLGQVYQARGDFDQAEQEYRQAVMFARRQPEIKNMADKLIEDLPAERRKYQVQRHLKEGASLDGLGKYSAALEEFQKARELDPNNSECEKSYQDILKKTGSSNR